MSNKIKLLIGLIIVLLLASGLFIWFNWNGISSKADYYISPITIRTLYPSFYKTEPVTIIVKNNSNRAAKFKNAFFLVKDSNNYKIFQSVKTSFDLNPGEEKNFTWDQKNQNATGISYINAGNYSVEFKNVADFPASFSITSRQGSDGHFTISRVPSDKTFKTYFTSPQTVREAIENYYGLNQKHPNGLLIDDRPGNSPYDPQYFWHFDSQDTVMSELSAELCDGWVEDIGKDPDYWFKSVKRFCPWGGLVSALE